MRKIKYRIWHKDEKRFLTTQELHSYNISPIDGHVLYLDGHDCVDTLMPVQSTGLHDKSGTEIYEGDIIKGYAYTKGFCPGQVEFCSEVYFNIARYCVGDEIYLGDCYIREVVGNKLRSLK